MWENILNWWQVLWVDHKPVATAIAGFISALLIFVLKDAVWQSRVTRLQKLEDFRQKQLEKFYAPLYIFYRESYSRFDYWHSQNLDTVLEKQAFFEAKDAEKFVESLFTEQSVYASKELIILWTNFKAVNDKVEKKKRRSFFVEELIKEYNSLRKDLNLNYSEKEVISGVFD